MKRYRRIMLTRFTKDAFIMVTRGIGIFLYTLYIILKYIQAIVLKPDFSWDIPSEK